MRTRMPLLFALSLCLFSQMPLVLSQQMRTHYIAGVVEFRPNELNNATENLAAYLEIINSTEAAPTDVIVFPEMTLSTNAYASFVPDPNEELIVPCDAPSAYHELLVELSCAARRVRKYLVVNVAEKTQCPDDALDMRQCAADGLNMYNTNVAFDREGRVVSRYRKINLYGEPKNVTWQPQVGWFDTDFGVRFGHFVCFDILFYMPSQILVEQLNVRDFIFPTMWFSQLPFLTGVQFQFAWAYGNDVNLLAAGASRPQVGNTGSGIYTGRNDPLVALMQPSIGDRRLLVAKVPIKTITAPSKQRLFNANGPTSSAVAARAQILQQQQLNRKGHEMSIAAQLPFDMRMKRDYLELYESVPLDLSTGNYMSRELCNGNHTLCCHFELRWRTMNATRGSQYYAYRLGVFDGWRREDGAAENLLKNCALFTCLNDSDDIMECGKLYASNTDILIEPQLEFEHILIEVTLPRTQQYLVMPNSLLDTLMPLAISDFSWQDELSGPNHTVRYRLNATVSNLLTFSIYGNYFNGSPNVTDNDKGTAATTTSSAITLGIVMLFSTAMTTMTSKFRATVSL